LPKVVPQVSYHGFKAHCECEVVQLTELGHRSGMTMRGVALLGPKLGKIILCGNSVSLEVQQLEITDAR